MRSLTDAEKVVSFLIFPNAAVTYDDRLFEGPFLFFVN
jgi:hypothetical protein